MTTNPLLEAYTLPPLDRIQPEHFGDAIDHVITDARIRVEQIRNDTNTANYDNTVITLDTALRDITRIKDLLITYQNAMLTQEMSDAYEYVNQEISNFTKNIFQDQVLAARFRAVTKPTDAQDLSLYNKISRDFETSGAFLDAAGQQRLKEIDTRLISLSSNFNLNMTKGALQQQVLITDAAELDGLPEDTRSALHEKAKENGHEHGWLIVPERMQIDAMLETANNRDFRRKIYEALQRIGKQEPYDNEPIIKEMQALRYERSTMLGYPNYAAFAVSRMMPENTAQVEEYLAKVGEGALPKFEDTVRKIQAYATSNGGPRTLEPWDIGYWGNRYREQTYGFDAEQYKHYFPLDKAVDGFFKTASRIFNITFTENTAYPRYHEDTKAYDVTDNATGKPVGILYTDFFSRNHKDGGAWMLPIQSSSEGKPRIVSMNMNLMKPAGDKMPLLGIDDMATLFHEGGHALHGLLGTNTRHPTLQGIGDYGACSSDYIEFFSTILENWPQHKACLDSVAGHHETGAPIPDDLLKARMASSMFLAERPTLKVVQNSRRDIHFHSVNPAEYKGSEAAHREADIDHPYAYLVGSYPLTRWTHLFSDAHSEYAAGYFSYLWSQGIADLGFEPFSTGDVFDAEKCERLKHLYQYGVSRKPADAFAEYHGHAATPDEMANALLKGIGADKPPRIALGKTAETSR